MVNGLINIKDETGEFILRLGDGRVMDTKGWHDWEWAHGVGLYSIWQYYQPTGDESCSEIIEDWFRDRFAAGGTTRNGNTTAVFLTLAHVSEKSSNPTCLPWLDGWAAWAYREQLWDDTLMMAVVPLV